MTTAIDSTLSMSALRQALPKDSHVSMADTLPPINFGFDELRDRMAKFTHRFDEFIAEGRKRVLEERNQFRRSVAEVQENENAKQRAIETLLQKSSDHSKTVAKEAAEANEMESALASVTTQRDGRVEQRDRLRDEIAATQKQIAQRVEAQRAHAVHLNAQARFNSPELDFWTDCLCMQIDGTGKVDQLRFIFSHIDERDWEKEASFDLSTEKREYEVHRCRPKLDSDSVERCVEQLNEHRDLGRFLKSMRGLFVEIAKRQ